MILEALAAQSSGHGDDSLAGLQTLLGVIVGALLGGGAQLLTSRVQDRQSRRRELFDFRRAQYFAALDTFELVESSFGDYMMALSGRWEPEDSDTSPEAEDMRARDGDAALAIGAMFAASREMNRTKNRVDAIGSREVSERITSVDEALSGYMTGALVAEKFVAADANKFLQELRKLMDQYIVAIRADLQIDKLLTSSK
jgi:hypothetical protein